MKQRLEWARKLAEEMPRGEQQQQLLEQIKQRDAKIHELCGDRLAMFGMLDQFMNEFGFDDEDEEFNEEFF
jgi:hypothetical protein